MAKMESLLAKQAKLREIFRNQSLLLRTAAHDSKPLEVLFLQLEDRFKLLDEVNKSIENLGEKQNIVVNYEEIFVYRDEFQELKQLCTATSTKNVSPITNHLPKIEFPKFDGEVKNYLNFWGHFKKIHENQHIGQVDKLLFLTNCCSGKALELVQTFPVNDDSYSKVIELIVKRFGQPKFLIDYYIREILKLIIGKNEMILSDLYDSLETQLRALETLGVTTHNYEAMLYPLIEASLPVDTFLSFERYRNYIGNEEINIKKLLEFLANEVQGQARLGMVQSLKAPLEHPATGAVLFSGSKQKPIQKTKSSCAYCSKINHVISNCFSFKKLDLEARQEIVKKHNLCFVCLRRGHSTANCRANNTCDICDNKSHATILCHNKNPSKSVTCHIKNIKSIYLQTLCISMKTSSGIKAVRVLCDSGSQRSYITIPTVKDANLKPSSSLLMTQTLFGGVILPEKRINVYNIQLMTNASSFLLDLEVLETPCVNNDIWPIADVQLLLELQKQNIFLSDNIGNTENSSINILLGADVLGNLLTGNQYNTNQGPIAVETSLGWTLMGPSKHFKSNKTISCHVTDIWQLDSIGIMDPIDVIKLTNKEKIDLFKNLISFEDGRYTVPLPWRAGHPPLLPNREIALQRLNCITKRLKASGHLFLYSDVFKLWEKDGVIELAPKFCSGIVHYLPHRAVINYDKSTKIRPVFDGSCKSKSGVSINECLETGPNLMATIPTILSRFRENNFGVVADIKKAFLQISIKKNDRDALRFLWWDDMGNIKDYRFRRVMFGLTSSPFHLAATIVHHLDLMEKEAPNIVKILRLGFYVDDLVVSLPTQLEANNFKSQAQELMQKAKFELTSWAQTHDKIKENVSVLGLLWNTEHDTLSIKVPNFAKHNMIVKTKRELLSKAQSIFDPIGYLCPYLITIKLLVRESWKLKLAWDDPLPLYISNSFQQWCNELPHVSLCSLPRALSTGMSTSAKKSIHVFVDASKDIYAACVFLRTEENEKVIVQLVQARNRIAPMEGITIPRLELLAALIGSRLYSNIVNDLSWQDIPAYFWSDSMVVLCWLQRPNEWKNFVSNRVREIRQLTNPTSWRKIPGTINIADLPSRGCSVAQLIETKWWEGPDWLYLPPDKWPQQDIEHDPEAEIEFKAPSSILLVAENVSLDLCNITKYFSSFTKTVRMIAWIYRFYNNSKKSNKTGPLTSIEITNAEKITYKFIQNTGLTEKHYSNLKAEVGSDQLIVVFTRVLDDKNTSVVHKPILLPGDHILVQRMILCEHKNRGHAGVLTLISLLREKFWIPKARQIVKKILRQCCKCRRFSAKPAIPAASHLPLARTATGPIFDVTGVDNFGPLYLKDGSKVWVTLFTCAVYRAVHLELVLQLTTEAFLQAFRRFVARRGRPSTIYSDCGLNFIGASNLLKSLEDYVIEQKIKWIHNPPRASFYGGFFERMVRCCKESLKIVLGNAHLTADELGTILCETEALVNARPITYLSNDANELCALTPSLFLHEISNIEMSDFDQIDIGLRGRATYLFKIRESLKSRFRKEYLTLLLQKAKNNQTRPLKVGELVLVEDENNKRQTWPIGRVVEIFKSKDGNCRVAKVKVSTGNLIRPFQKLYPLELDLSNVNTEKETHKTAITKSGRLVKRPSRFE